MSARSARASPKLDAPAKATGETRYLQDLDVPGMLHGKIRRSDRVHAKILSIDVSKARRGARRARGPHRRRTSTTSPSATARTTPRSRATGCAASATRSPPSPPRPKRPPSEACRLIQVEYEDLPADLHRRRGADAGRVRDPRGAQGQHALHLRLRARRRREGRGRRARTWSRTSSSCTFVTHCCMGTSAILAAFDADGKLTLTSLTQVPFLYRRDMAAIVGMRPEDIRVIQPPIGGGVRLEARHLPVRADRRAPGPRGAAAGAHRLHAAGGVRRLADAPAGDREAAQRRATPGGTAHLPRRLRCCSTTAATPRGAPPPPS